MVRESPSVPLDPSSTLAAEARGENDNGARRAWPRRAAPLSPVARLRVEGQLLATTGDLEGALAAFRGALALLGPGDPEARAELWVCIGEVRWAAGEVAEAHTDFRRALLLAPGFRPAVAAMSALDAASKSGRAKRRSPFRAQKLVGAMAWRYARAEFVARRAGVRSLDIRIASLPRAAGARR